MAAIPILEELAAGPSAQIIAQLSGLEPVRESTRHIEETLGSTPGSPLGSRNIPRKLSIYSASAGFDLLEELDYLTYRTIEPNVFFNPRFLAPAMPRLDDRQVRLMLIRDENEVKSRLRFLMPYTIERAGFAMSGAIMRAWATPFGPQSTPLIDRDDPVGVLNDLFDMLGRKHLKLPDILVLPEMRLDGPVAQLIRTIAIDRNLPLVTASQVERPILQSAMDGDDYLRQAIGGRRVKEYRRLWRRLAEKGDLAYVVSRNEDDIRIKLEQFLVVEASGWKGQRRSAMAVDRFRAAFAREAVNNLAARDLVRIHSLELDGRVIAILIVFVEAGEAWTWKIAYDEKLAAFSPGVLLMVEMLKNHLDDPNIVRTDSCAVPDHPVASRLFSEREKIGTLVIGLNPAADRAARKAASQLHLYRRTQNLARLVRERLRQMTGRD
ncbi:GNAT family N-acetyltransferase [Phyllobacterium sp. 0TCS1.6C]|uniref:type IV secretion system effector crotonyl transferase BspF n=1 Tax=unclassified Phyllobacterium TaxID=2638441 RepID=UPI00226443E7|nr:MULTISPECIES: GNAT family N-acetyltransferase [unclassified Phyllobacterium]MCX8281582.1 GNAT family N-acetyltransferase [Phyllobacterium sp. 0TCS1.6C]MCX8292822.1 GNAT family N-acetyltransferase [Phyllobacterium sp. 0TCS1.6A]